MKILVAGLGKSGTTGLFYLIANSIGKGPKLLFEPKKCPAGLESEQGDVVAKILLGAKFNAASFAHFDKKITLVRDPRDRIISLLLYSQFHANYLADDGRVRIVRECLERKEASPSRVSIREILGVVRSVGGQSKAKSSYPGREKGRLARLDDYIANFPEGLVYKYEDFVSGEYAPLEEHLGMLMSGTADVPESVKRVERTKGSGDWRNWFTAEDVREYQPMLAPWLEKHGYDAKDWALSAAPAIAHEHCSGYFMRLVEEYRKKNSGKVREFMRLVGDYRKKNSGKVKESASVKKQAASNGLLTGKVMKAEPGIVAGWAIGADSGQPVRIVLLVNGSQVAQAVADKLRPGLMKRGIHPTGRCGFNFRFKPGTSLQVGDQVTVKPVDGSFALKNSPCVVSAAAANAR